MMRAVWLFICTLIAFVTSGTDAQAGPVFVAVISAGGGIGAAFAATTVGGFLTGTIAGRLLTSVALSALQAATARKPRPAGLTNERKGTGSTNPRGFPLGLCATPGDEVCTPMSHGKAGKVQNAYGTFVIALSDVPGVTVNRMWIDKELVTLSTPSADPNLAPYGQRITGRFDGYAWVKFYDGTQTVADPMLLSKYSAYPERPWSADMKLTGCAYAIVTCRWNTTLFRSEPQFLFELNGIPLYDPRKDSTVGGSGAHRWANKATWEPSNNPKVIEYNILRGIDVPSFGIWGGAATAADLPLANWFTAMNECDVAITTLAGTVPQYRAGRFVFVAEFPADVIDDLNLVCTGQTAEIGGTFKTRVGGPGLPVLFITDDDWVVSQPQDFDPFDRADQRPNYITANYPEPAIAWGARPAPALANAGWEAEDGGRRETALEFAACPHVAQVQRVMASFAKDTRRARKHGGILPADAAVLEPLDCVSWTSTRNGYTAKLFEVSAIDDGARNMLQHPSLREADPADYSWTPASEVAVTNPSSALVPAPSFAVPGFLPTAGVIVDNAGGPRRVSVDIPWDGSEQDGVRAFEWEINLWTGSAVGALVDNGSTTNVAAGLVRRTSGVVPQTAYAVRARFVGDFDGPWTAYQIVITGAAQTTDAQGGELIANGNFAAGTLANWFAEVGAAYQSVQPYTLGTNPFTHILRYQFTANGQVGITRTGADVPGSPRITAIPVQPGEQYRIQGLYAVQSGSVYLDIRHEWVLGNGTVVAGVAGPNYTGGATGAFLPLSYTDTAPAGAVGLYVKTASQCTFTTGDVLFANISARAMTGASLVRDNAINRAALTDDSLQDVYRTTDFTRYTPAATSNGFVLATHSVPAQVDGVILKRGVSFEARRPAGFTGNAPPNEVRVELQGRIRVFGGAFSAWRVLSSWTGANLLQFGSGTGPWDANSDTGNLMGPFDEYQYQLIVETDIQVSSANTWVGNANFTVARTTKGGA